MTDEAANEIGAVPPSAERLSPDERAGVARLERLADARCIDCNYSLRGLTKDVCPECGMWFDPEIAGTFRHPRIYPDWWVKYRDPPGWTAALILAAYTLFLVVEFSAPGGSFVLSSCIHGLTALIAIPWAIIRYFERLLARVQSRERAPHILRGRPQRNGVWMVLPLCALLFVSMITTDWPIRLRFELSREAFDREVANFAPPPGVPNAVLPPSAPWIGLFRVNRIWRSDSGAVFFATGSVGFLDRAGFLHLDPDVALPEPGETLPQSGLVPEASLGGGWYVGKDLF